MLAPETPVPPTGRERLIDLTDTLFDGELVRWVTCSEGGDWVLPAIGKKIHSLRTEAGREWDAYGGWRDWGAMREKDPDWAHRIDRWWELQEAIRLVRSHGITVPDWPPRAWPNEAGPREMMR